MLKNTIYSTPKLFSFLALFASLVICGSAQSEAVNFLSKGLQASLTFNNTSIELSGVVGDVPVVDAIIIVKDVDGRIVAASVSNETARYNVSISSDAVYPLTVLVKGGMDTVTNTAPAFEMSSVVESVYQTTANINSFTTLITKSAEAMGGLSLRNISLAKLQITNSMGFGLNNITIPDVIASSITEVNVASYVKASAALGEWIRRTYVVMATEEGGWTQGRLIEVLSADLIDGTLNGKGAEGANEVVAATANVLSAQIMVETLSQTLNVAGVDVTGLL